MTNSFRLRLLGSVLVERDGEPLDGFKSRKALALLGYLSSQGEPVERSLLTNLFWPDKSETRARNNLSQVLHNLSSLWPDSLKTDFYTVQFIHSELNWVDTRALESLVKKGDLASLALAGELYRGDFMNGVYLDDCPEFEQWLRVEQESWRRRIIQILCPLIEAYAGQGELELALEQAARLLTIDPCHEETHRQKMSLLTQSGQRNAALTHFETCCQFLKEELGVEPEAETIALYKQIKTGLFEADPGQAELEEIPDPPAPTLLSFNNLPAQSTSFIGRDTELAVISKRIKC